MQPGAHGEQWNESRGSPPAAPPPPGVAGAGWRPPPQGPGFGWRFFDWMGALGGVAVIVAASIPGYGVDEAAAVEDFLGGPASGICSGLPADLQASCESDARNSALDAFAESGAGDWTLTLWSHAAGAWTAALAIVVLALLLVRGLQILPRRVNVYFLVLPVALLQTILIVFALSDQSNIFTSADGERQALTSDLIQLELGAYAAVAAVGVVLVGSVCGFLLTGGSSRLSRGLAAAQHRAAAASTPREVGSWPNPGPPHGTDERPHPHGSRTPWSEPEPGGGNAPGSSSSA